jgi:mono/diheme cytochrome c family protein
VKRSSTVAILVCAVLGGLALFASRSQAANAGASKAVQRGAQLVKVGGCNDCHTPWKMGPKGPEPDKSRFLSGHPENVKMPPPPQAAGPWIWFGAATNTAYAGPWGISYAINLTPDKNTGIAGGAWSEATFVKAIKTGKHMGTSRPIMPPMPWEAYRNYSDADLKAIYAYLMTIPAVVNHVPDAVEAPPPPAK